MFLGFYYCGGDATCQDTLPVMPFESSRLYLHNLCVPSRTVRYFAVPMRRFG
jgi:hypothetical protein